MRKLLILISFIPLVSLAQPMPMPPGHQPPQCNSMSEKIKRDKPKHGLHNVLRNIDLSEPQRNDVKNILDNAHAKMSEYRQQQHQLREELEWLSTSLEYDSEAANKIIEQIADLKALQLKHKMATEQKIINLLTEKQKAILSMQKKISLLDKR